MYVPRPQDGDGFPVLASKTGNITIDDKNVVDKTYPNYWSDYQSLSRD